jgi:uncharacterized membrane protein YraQ (UPF0718 family)
MENNQMAIPVFIVTGFLGAGKTLFINNLLSGKKWSETKLLIIQFESGETELKCLHDHYRSMTFPKKILEQQPDQIVKEIASCLSAERVDEIWIEWNGITPFSQLYSLLLHPSLQSLCKVRKVMHLADGASIENILGRTGSALPDQIANSDFIIVSNNHASHNFKRVRSLLHGINPRAEIIASRSYQDIFRNLENRRHFPAQILLILFFLIAVFHSVFKPIYEVIRTPLNTIINLFSGIILQAIPFLLIGVLLSSALQILIPKEVIERRFPKSVGPGILAAILCGFCLPVCDCASIPIFKGLIKKGVPLPAAVTFLTVTPIINPVVILSTYYAFGGDLSIVISRVCFGIISAVLIGTIFVAFPPKGQILSGGSYDSVSCNCGCYDADETSMTKTGKIALFLRHSQAEFFNVGKYLVIGALISSVLQTFSTKLFIATQSGPGLVFSILFMMGVAFLLSLCSSSDAVIARSFATQLPMGAVMGFLIFGPMMDLKNVLMLSANFSKQFVSKLIFVAFIVCFTVVFLFSSLGGL